MCLVLGLLVALCAPQAAGQLAITELMSNATGDGIPPGAGFGSDFWELTNFGPEPIDLSNYTYSDRMGTPRPMLVQPGDPPLIIAPLESLIFVRFREVTNETQFRNWWGGCLPASTRVRMVAAGPAFDSRLDGLRVYDSAGNVVDQVDFGRSREGVTFAYDINTGDFGTFSILGECGACGASVTNDVGSPGVTCGPLPLGILEEPADLAVCAGTEAVLSMRAAGLPRPKFQWYFGDDAIPEGTASSLIIPNAGPADAGPYHVVIHNGLAVTQSVTVTLTVSTTPTPPVIVSAPVAMVCYTGQTARFAVTACAYPPAGYQWFSNGIPILSATERSLRLPNASLEMSGTEYCVRVQNALGTITACAPLTVTVKPRVMITEIMPAPDTNCTRHGQWFELTNHGTNTVNLLGCRFSDRFSLEGVVTVTDDIIVQPGESVIFVERLNPAEFVRWWGVGNLPAALQIFTYVGLGFAQVPINGDEGLYFWSAAAEELDDTLDDHIYAEARLGFSLYYDCFDDPDTLACAFGADSEAGLGGAFRAVECGDIGSPGYTTNPPPRFVSIACDGTNVTVRWRAVEDRRYRLSYKDGLKDSVWRELSKLTATNSLQTAADPSPRIGVQRFYQIEELPWP